MRTKGPIVYENMETSIPGIFACGNVAQVHDLVDFVTMESIRAGRAAAEYAAHGEKEAPCFELYASRGLNYILPQRARMDHIDQFLDVFFRVNDIYKAVSYTHLDVYKRQGRHGGLYHGNDGPCDRCVFFRD